MPDPLQLPLPLPYPEGRVEYKYLGIWFNGTAQSYANLIRCLVDYYRHPRLPWEDDAQDTTGPGDLGE